jgi:hypothetical protein
MSTPVMVFLLIAVSVGSASAGWVLADARARGLPTRKAVTWALLCTQEWPLMLLLYRRIRPTRLRRDDPPASA